MSEVMKCNRCGAIYEKEYENVRILETRVCGQKLNEFDLCPDCVKDFHSFMDSGQNKKNAESEKTVEYLTNEFLSWSDDLCHNVREVYSGRPLTEQEKARLIAEWKSIGVPFDILFVEPKTN